MFAHAEECRLDTGCCRVQAALKVIAEMQRIPMPSPRKAGPPQPENSEGSEENSADQGNCSSASQQQENVHSGSEGASC